jgi:hypothetical protein
MEVKENRPDACAASGTANSIYKDFSTDAPDIQEELTGPVLPDECAADIVSFCSEQTIAYDDLLEYARGGLWRGHVARQSCLLSGIP